MRAGKFHANYVPQVNPTDSNGKSDNSVPKMFKKSMWRTANETCQDLVHLWMNFVSLKFWMIDMIMICVDGYDLKHIQIIILFVLYKRIH